MRLLCFLLPFLTVAQEATFTSDVRVVNVYATVHDKQGQVVSGLNQADFSLKENGQAQAIRYFSKETDRPLTLGLLVDTSMSQRRVLGDEIRASSKFIDQVVRENRDQAFAIHFDREVELVQDLTASRRKLQRSLEELDTPKQMQHSPDPGMPRGRRGGSGGTALYDSVLLASNEIMKNQSGRKALILLSDGVDNGSKVGMEQAVEAAQKSETLVYSILFSDEESYGGNAHPAMGRGGRRGGGGKPAPHREAVDGKRVLRQISVDTGGGFFEVSKKTPLDQTFASIERDLRSQYSIGYVPEHPAAPGTYREIQLTVLSGKNLVVLARPGYWAK